MSEQLIDRIAGAIHDAEYRAEPWEKFDTLAEEDAESYRIVARAVVDELGLLQEIRTNVMSSAGMTVNAKTGETTYHSDIRHDYRYVTNWKTHMPPGVIS